jgi:hypothetical protein
MIGRRVRTPRRSQRAGKGPGRSCPPVGQLLARPFNDSGRPMGIPSSRTVSVLWFWTTAVYSTIVSILAWVTLEVSAGVAPSAAETACGPA